MFRKKEVTVPAPEARVDYPEGVCIKTEKGYFYVGKKFRHQIKHKRVLESWRFRILNSSEAGASHLLISKAPLGFRPGSVIQDFATRKTYVISQSKRRLVTSPDVLTNYGFSENDILVVSQEEANLHEDGPPLS